MDEIKKHMDRLISYAELLGMGKCYVDVINRDRQQKNYETCKKIVARSKAELYTLIESKIKEQKL